MTDSETKQQPGRGVAANPAPDDALRLRYRIRFAKRGLLRWTSHRDLARLWERLVRRAQLKLSMTEGFHPKPRIGFPSALALGISGENEVVEMDMAERFSAQDLLERLSQDDQPGLEIRSVQLLPEGSGKGKIERTEFTVTAPDPELGASAVDAVALEAAISKFLQQDTVTVTRKEKPLTVSVAQQIIRLEYNGAIELSLAACDGANLKPTDVLDLIGCSDWISHGSQVTRTDVVLKCEFESTDPEFLAIANQTPSTGETTQEVPT